MTFLLLIWGNEVARVPHDITYSILSSDSQIREKKPKTHRKKVIYPSFTKRQCIQREINVLFVKHYSRQLTNHFCLNQLSIDFLTYVLFISGWQIDENPVSTAFEIFWLIFEPILFGVTGTVVKVNKSFLVMRWKWLHTIFLDKGLRSSSCLRWYWGYKRWCNNSYMCNYRHFFRWQVKCKGKGIAY